MDIKEIQIYLEKDWDGYRNTLVSILFNENNYIQKINGYIFDNSGKQLRPLLALLAARALSDGSVLPKESYYSAAVAEIIHTSSLLHDDVADNGDIRRGAPTVKAFFSPAASVLSGDYWLSKGLESLIINCPTEILHSFTDAMRHLSEGELIQMELSDTLRISKEDYFTVIFNKTSSLFIAALKSGAISVKGKPEYVSALAEYGKYLGHAFQIRDDIFDYSPCYETGKTTGADISERKITLPMICAMEAAEHNEREKMLRLIDGQPQNIVELATDFVCRYNGLQSAQTELEFQSRKALEALASLPESKEKDYLSGIASYVGIRKS